MLLIVAGVLTLTWVVVVWQWQDPFTAIYTHIQQNRLVAQLRAARPRVPPAADEAATSPRSNVQVAAEARAYQRTLHTGDPVGRLQIGRIGLKMVVVQGTDHETLKKGPGHYEPSALPGRGPPDLHRRSPHDLPRAVRAHQRHQGRRLHHLLRPVRHVHLPRAASLHRSVRSALRAAGSRQRDPAAAGMPPALLRDTPLHRRRDARSRSRRPAAQTYPVKAAAS